MCQFIAVLGEIFNSNLFSGFLGVILGGLLTGWLTYKFNKKHVDELERKERIALAKTLRAELSSLWKRYMNVSGKVIENWDQQEPPLIGMIETRQDYFTIFNNSANLLGLFKPEDSQKIIEAYINGKAFLEELIHYGNLTTRYTEADSGFDSRQKCDERLKISPQISGYFKYLKERHNEVEKLIEETTTLLDKIS